MAAGDILFGDGVFKLGATVIGLTRGGGKFVVEREYREIAADGDYGPVKDRIRKIKSVAKLTMNMLEMIPADLAKMYPATTLTTDVGVDTVTGNLDIATGDYNDTLSWTGKTKSGRGVVISLQNAINLENIDWSLVDKEETIPTVTFTATYLESARTTEPWSIVYGAVV